MEAGYIMNNNEIEKFIVGDEEIIKAVFEVCPQIIALSKLLYLVHYPKLYQYYNGDIVQLLECCREFKAIIDKNFIEVCEDGSFDYEYGDICGTHHCMTSVGYVKRTPEMEELITYPWDMY